MQNLAVGPTALCVTLFCDSLKYRVKFKTSSLCLHSHCHLVCEESSVVINSSVCCRC